jgi:hypothetical protein
MILAAWLFCVCGCEHKDLRTAQERWAIFPSGASYNFVQSVSPRYLWMQGGLWCGQVQQYDMKERRLNVFTARDGLPLSPAGAFSTSREKRSPATTAISAAIHPPIEWPTRWGRSSPSASTRRSSCSL